MKRDRVLESSDEVAGIFSSVEHLSGVSGKPFHIESETIGMK